MHYLYLHGFCSGKNSYKGSFLRERFAEHGLQLQTPDLNGEEFERTTVSRQLAEVEGLCSSLSGGITLMGSSLGAWLAVLLAEKNQQIENLVLIAPAFRFASRRQSHLSPRQLKSWRRDGFIEVFHYGFGENRRLHHRFLEDALTYEDTPLLRQLPTLIIHGRHDEVVDAQLSIDFARSHPQAQLLLLNSDHQMTDQVEAIWEAVRRFLAL